MKHYILAKFRNRDDTERLFPEITELFRRAQALDGVENVTIRKSNSARENRYSIMIEIDLSHAGLEVFDASDVHREWKAVYGDRLESKAKFDCE